MGAGGVVTMMGSSSVSGNSAGNFAGGIFVHGTVTLRDSSSVHDNTATTGGGIYITAAAHFVLATARVSASGSGRSNRTPPTTSSTAT